MYVETYLYEFVASKTLLEVSWRVYNWSLWPYKKHTHTHIYTQTHDCSTECYRKCFPGQRFPVTEIQLKSTFKSIYTHTHTRTPPCSTWTHF